MRKNIPNVFKKDRDVFFKRSGCFFLVIISAENQCFIFLKKDRDDRVKIDAHLDV